MIKKVSSSCQILPLIISAFSKKSLYSLFKKINADSRYFSELKDILDSHVANFVQKLDFDLDDRDIVLEDMWINVLNEGGSHGSHIHPHSVISGTTYVSIPKEAGEIRFEDPRLQFMMSAPPRKKDARTELKTFHSHHPVAGEVLLWESWLRHEVRQNGSKANRVSISFNYKWSD